MNKIGSAILEKKVVECLDDKAQDEKCIESLQKQTMGIIQFSKQILSY